MKSKKLVYEKQLIRKKMISLIIYGIIFLISTIAFYFVNTSKAKNVIKIGVSVIDKDANLEISNYDLKVQEEDGKYKADLYPIQNGFVVKKYKFVTEKEYEEIKNKYEKVDEENKEKEEEKEGTSPDEIEDRKKIDLTESKKEIELTEEQLKTKKIYLVAEYDFKEIDNKKIYNKIISGTTEKNNINITGYMPEDSEISIKDKDLKEVQEKLKNNFQDVNKELNIIAAYDIKIISNEKEYEPEDFD